MISLYCPDCKSYGMPLDGCQNDFHAGVRRVDEAFGAAIQKQAQEHVEMVKDQIISMGTAAIRDGCCGRIERVEFISMPMYTQLYVCRKPAGHEPPCNIPSEGAEVVPPSPGMF